MRTLLVLAILALAFAQEQAQIDYQTCQARLMGVNFDLSSMAGNDLSYSTGSRTFYLSFCQSIVRSSRCASLPKNVNFCAEDSYSSTSGYSSWSTAAPKITWMLQKPGDVNSGLFLVFPNATKEDTRVNLILNCAAGSLARIYNVEVKDNIYYVYVQTSRACPSAPEPFQPCTWTHYGKTWDLRPLASKSVKFFKDPETFHMSFCGWSPMCQGQADYPNICGITTGGTTTTYSTWSTFGMPITWSQLDPEDPSAGLNLMWAPNKLYPYMVNVTMGCMQGVETYITEVDVDKTNHRLHIFAESPLACPTWPRKN